MLQQKRNLADFITETLLFFHFRDCPGSYKTDGYISVFCFITGSKYHCKCNATLNSATKDTTVCVKPTTVEDQYKKLCKTKTFPSVSVCNICLDVRPSPSLQLLSCPVKPSVSVEASFDNPLPTLL